MVGSGLPMSAAVMTVTTPGCRQRGRRVDAHQLPVRDGTAQDRSVQHTGKAKVIDELSLATKQPKILDACDWLADIGVGRCHPVAARRRRGITRLLRRIEIPRAEGARADRLFGSRVAEVGERAPHGVHRRAEDLRTVLSRPGAGADNRRQRTLELRHHIAREQLVAAERLLTRCPLMRARNITPPNPP